MPSITFTSAAKRDYKRIPSHMLERVNSAIDSLETDPLPPGHRKLTGEKTLYRIRVGTFRIVYQYLEKKNELTVTRIRHRREVYR